MNTISVKNLKRKSNGVEADFYILKYKGEKVGLKVYCDKASCEEHKGLQITASRHGIGPAVKSPTFKVTGLHYGDGYGFMTELADVNKNRVFSEDVLDKLDDEFFKVFGFYHDDFHEGNVGYLSNGKLVYIDFGYWS